MKKYRFPLDTVLRVRRIEEDREKARLLAANRAVDSAVASVTRRRDHLDSLSAPAGGSWAGFHAEQSHRLGLAAAVGHAAGVLEARRTVATERRQDWGAARQRVASLERLDERLRDEHAIEAGRDAQRLVDDLVSARYARKDPA